MWIIKKRFLAFYQIFTLAVSLAFLFLVFSVTIILDPDKTRRRLYELWKQYCHQSFGTEFPEIKLRKINLVAKFCYSILFILRAILVFVFLTTTAFLSWIFPETMFRVVSKSLEHACEIFAKELLRRRSEK
jgi:hypothetical protein